MKIYRISGDIIAYHGTSRIFDRFDYEYASHGVFWFTEDIGKIRCGESGASSNKYICKVRLHVGNSAGWGEYERYGLGEIRGMGYDSILLDDDWVIYDSDDIEILEWVKS